MNQWEITVRVSTTSNFEHLKMLLAAEAKKVANCKSVRDCYSNWGGTDGAHEYGGSIVLVSPTINRIEQLRAEADELEQTLVSP